MKKLMIFLCLFILFILPFGCDGCVLRSGSEYNIDRTIIQGGYVTIELFPDPNIYTASVTKAPNHAQMTQFEANNDQKKYFYFYRASTNYIGYDTTKITFHSNEANGQYVDLRSVYYTLIFRTIADTSGSD